jgi:hypothetical protein
MVFDLTSINQYIRKGGDSCLQTRKQECSIRDDTSLRSDAGLRSTRSQGANYSMERARPGLPSTSAKRLAKGLGWFSIGLGLAELLAPRAIANISGVSNKHTGLIRLYGLRELGAGITIFAQEKPTEGVWSRVIGDALDLTSLGIAATNPEAKLGRVAFATANVLAVTALDVMCAMQLSSSSNHGIHAKGSCIVNSTPEEVYQFWRNFENLPRFMRHVDSVTEMGDGRSRWKVKGPAGMEVEWDATIVADRSQRSDHVAHAGKPRDVDSRPARCASERTAAVDEARSSKSTLNTTPSAA